MSLVINTNSIATTATRNLNANQANLQRSLARLSSGSKIVIPADDAGGLAVANKLKAVLNRNVRAQQNVQNALSFMQVQDGAMKSATQILDRISELKTMSLDVTKNDLDVDNYDVEFNQLQDQLVNIRAEKFNGINLFRTEASDLSVYSTELGKGTITTAGVAQVNTITAIDGDDAVDSFTVNIGGVDLAAVAFNNTAADTAGDIITAINAAGAGVTAALSGVSDITVTADTAGTAFTLSITPNDDAAGTTAAATSSITTANTAEVVTAPNVNLSRDILFEAAAGQGLTTAGDTELLDSATNSQLADFTVDEIKTFIQTAATARAQNGAEMQRLNRSSDMLLANNTNLEAAHSRLADVDFATESTNFAKFNILTQAAAAMLSQANNVPSVALQLLA